MKPTTSPWLFSPARGCHGDGVTWEQIRSTGRRHLVSYQDAKLSQHAAVATLAFEGLTKCVEATP